MEEGGGGGWRRGGDFSLLFFMALKGTIKDSNALLCVSEIKSPAMDVIMLVKWQR